MTTHTIVSYAKSSIRLIGFALLANHLLVGAALILSVAEVLGILEELPGAYKGTETDA